MKQDVEKIDTPLNPQKLSVENASVFKAEQLSTSPKQLAGFATADRIAAL